MSKRYFFISLLLCLFSALYGTGYHIVTLQDESPLEGAAYLSSLLTDSLRNVLLAADATLSDKNQVTKQAARDKDDIYTITGGYIATDTQVMITLTLSHDSSLLKTLTATFTVDETLLDNFRALVKSLVEDSDACKSASQNINTTKHTQKLPRTVIDKQSRLIKQNRPESQILFSAGQTYVGLGFLYNDVATHDNLNIASPINRWKNNTSLYFRFELTRKYNLTYSGAFVDMIVPFIFDTDYFFSYSRIRVGYEYGYKGELFFCPSIDYMVGMYSKNAKDNATDVGVSLLTAGIGFDLRYIPRSLRLMLEAGFTLFPPYLPFIEDNGTGDDGPAYPFAVSVNGAVGHASWVFPLSPRAGAAFFNKSRDLGFFVSYSLVLMNVHYDTVVRDYSGYNEKLIGRYYGDEYSFLHEFRFGVMYQKIIK